MLAPASALTVTLDRRPSIWARWFIKQSQETGGQAQTTASSMVSSSQMGQKLHKLKYGPTKWGTSPLYLQRSLPTCLHRPLPMQHIVHGTAAHDVRKCDKARYSRSET